VSRCEFLKIGVRAVAVSIATASLFTLSGCAYFHPAFMTNASLARSHQQQTGVLVCERPSLRKANCTRMSRSEIQQFLDTQWPRY